MIFSHEPRFTLQDYVYPTEAECGYRILLTLPHRQEHEITTKQATI